MGPEDSAAVAGAVQTLVAALGPWPFVALILAGLLIWQAPKLWRRAESAAPPATLDAQARAIGRIEGLIESLRADVDDHDERLRDLEKGKRE